jgi:hypothetical protein
MSYQKNAECRRAMQKVPSRITGPFGRSSIGGECSLTPPISQFVTLSFGSRTASGVPRAIRQNENPAESEVRAGSREPHGGCWIMRTPLEKPIFAADIPHGTSGTKRP